MVLQSRREYDAPALEAEMQALWDEESLYQRVKRHRRNGRDFYFIDGPPYTSGAIHMGTAWNKVLKDVEVRRLRMLGYNVRDQAGYDMHGLPIEVKVERELGIGNKREIEEMGIDAFVGKCLDFAMRFRDRMTGQFKALGVWLDWDDPYMTITNEYIQSAWWTIKTAADKGLLAQSERVIPWCPRCGTALAEAEIEYWDEEDPSVLVRFPLEDGSGHIVIWTTTPWTIPSNLAIAVNPDFDYVRARVRRGIEEDTWIIHEDRLAPVAEAAGWEVVEVVSTCTGQELEGLRYLHPLEAHVPALRADMGFWKHKVVLADYVTAEMTGCVHTAPGHGPDDFETGRRYDLPPLSPVDESGTFTAGAGRYAGTFTKDADERIMADLEAAGALLGSERVTHRYGHCWRSKDPITYRTTKQWFLRVTEVRQRMLDEVLRIDWTPVWAGKNRQYDWVANTRDWCISRQRYWGIPLPVWRCASCGADRVVASAAELEGAAGYEEGMNLHRPWIDGVVLGCACGGGMRRVPDVLDVWLDSAVCSWAQLGYPQRKDEFERWWPCRFITEAHDQTRGWFYSQLGAGVIAFDRAPYDSVLLHGWAHDEDGKPMSKSLGNAIDPLEVTSVHGVDALRLYFMRASAPWEDLPFSVEGVRVAGRALNILWNVHYFATTYMVLDDFQPERFPVSEVVALGHKEDLWLLSRLNTLIMECSAHADAHQHHRAARAIESFVLDDLSRWYVRLVRDRTWTEGDNVAKMAAHSVLYEALRTVAVLWAPMLPYICDRIHRDLAGRSVHFENWPAADEDLINTELETSMDVARKAVEAIYAARQRANRKVRWPVRRVVIQVADEASWTSLARMGILVRTQANAHDVELLDPGTAWTEMKVRFEPDFKAIGPAFKRDGKRVADAIRAATSEPVTVEIDGKTVEVPPDMYRAVTDLPEGFQAESFDGNAVYVDLTLTDELLDEAYGREILRRIQEMRKEMDLHVEARIEVFVSGDERFEAVATAAADFLAGEARATGVTAGEGGAFRREWEVDGRTFTVGITQIEK
ncbi:MAG: isoleucine--tRNA ligase [Thermoplasmata archaeon]|nr:isoleucine--tRNA ligase [Thermoplasmata archaeon]